MAIYTRDTTGTTYVEELPLGIGETASASFEQTLRRSPVASLIRGGEQLYAEYREEAPLLDAATARQRVKEAGVNLTIPDDGMKENVLNILIKRKNEENRLASILERGPDGFIAGTVEFGASIGASLLDPINVASAFVPVYGQARYTSLLANASGGLARAGVRARVGAVEGAAGTVLTEGLIVAPVAFYEQADYRATDFLESVAFGTVFGGGLHMGVGALGDAFARTGTINTAQPVGTVPTTLNSLAPETRTDIMRGALGQALSGRVIDIEARLAMDPLFQNVATRALETTSLTPIRRFEPPAAGLTTPEEALGRAVNPEMVEPPLRVTTGAMNNLGEVPTYTTAREAERIQSALLRRTGERLEIKQLEDGSYTLLRPYDAQPVRRADGTPLSFETERAALKATKSITDLQGRDLTPVAFMEDGQMRFALVENAPKGMADAAKKNPQLVDLGIGMDRSINATSVAINEDVARNRFEQAYQRTRESYRAENMRLADMDAVRAIDETYAVAMQAGREEDIIADIDSLVDEARRVGDAVGARDLIDAELVKYDALIADAEAVGRGIEAAALCSIRRG